MSDELITIAVDPGVNGAIVWKHKNEIYSENMPSADYLVVELLCQLSKKSKSIEMYLEEPPLFAGKSIPGSAIGKLMWNTGILYGASIAYGFKIHRVRPAIWMKTHPVGTKGELTTSKWKNKLKARACELFPNINVTLANADALLILDSGLRKAIN
jgi:hypothetical protein